MVNTTNLNIRMDCDLKREFEDFCKDVGISVTAAISLFVKKTVAEQKIPFEISRSLPNDETKAAIAEVREMKKHPESLKKYGSFRELMQEVSADA